MNARTALSGFFICLPALVLCGVGAWFLTRYLPRMVASERAAVTRAYRQTAEELWRDPTLAETTMARPKGWHQVGKIGKTSRWRRQVAWGYEDDGAQTRIWIADGNDEQKVRCRSVDRIEIVDLKWLCWIGVPATLTVIFALTLCCLRFFVRYAKEREDFMAATAHDLTTPLVALRRFIGRDDGEARLLVARMIRLVENLTDFLSLGGRRSEPERQTFDIVHAYQEAYLLFREDFRSYFGGRDIEVSGPETLAVTGDETMTVQILWNLLANELKYAAPFGSVRVGFERRGRTVFVVFTDEGKGLTAHERRCIFRRYFRAKSVMLSGKGGFGIGLCTAREFARAMGGDLTVAANSPRGCVFTLKIGGVE